VFLAYVGGQGRRQAGHAVSVSATVHLPFPLAVIAKHLGIVRVQTGGVPYMHRAFLLVPLACNLRHL